MTSFKIVQSDTDDCLFPLELHTPDGGHVASVTSYTIYGEVCEVTRTHAALLAAAPVMLDALKTARQMFEALGDFDAAAQVNAAIKKAETFLIS